jgi:hypothetical protein
MGESITASEALLSTMFVRGKSQWRIIGEVSTSANSIVNEAVKVRNVSKCSCGLL